MAFQEKTVGWSLATAAAVAVVSTAALLIFESGSRRNQPTDLDATRAAAQSAGAKVIPTQPKLAVEPTPPGPKPTPLDPPTPED